MKRLCSSFFYAKSCVRLSQLAKRPQPIISTSPHQTECNFALL